MPYFKLVMTKRQTEKITQYKEYEKNIDFEFAIKIQSQFIFNKLISYQGSAIAVTY